VSSKHPESASVTFCAETYGPTARNYGFIPKDASDRFIQMARQGSSFLTADDIRVIKPVTDEQAATMTEDDLQEVAFDGQEVGEILLRGNIVMTASKTDEKDAKANRF
jgi:hypothetical protein